MLPNFSSLSQRQSKFAVATLVAISSTVASACPEVELVYARGTLQPQDLGNIGNAFYKELVKALPSKNVTAYAVVYPAAFQQDAGPGATDMSRRLIAQATACPSTSFVIGGYSQGASATVIAIGLPSDYGTDETIPGALAPRIKGVITFGNPLDGKKQSIAELSPLYGKKAVEVCNNGDPVCGNGFNFFAHLAYASNGSAGPAAAKIAALVLAK